MEIGRKLSRAHSVGVQVLAYAAAVAVGGGCLGRTVEAHPLTAMWMADVAATLVIFGFSRAMNNSSLYDPYWSLIPIPVVGWWWMLYAGQGPGLRSVLLFAVIVSWGTRLTWNFFRSWPGMAHEDWRYGEFREKCGRLYWPASLAGIHLFPTLLVFAGLVPAWVALSSRAPMGLLDYGATGVGFAAVLIQGIADQQLRAHRASHPPRGAILDRGLWRYSRHPNYFGEVLLWWSVWLFGFAANPGLGWTAIGPLAMTALFVFSSVPWTDRKTLETRPEYGEHMRKVSGLVPWFRREAG